jgi:glucan 1,3-beta-glucosidase
MRASTLIVAVAPSFVSAAGMMGFALGDKTATGACKAQSDYELDFDAISSESGAKLVRIYAASDCDTAKNILPAAKSKGFQVVLGIWCVPLNTALPIQG